ncbi:winged helix-turn-helix domain-containing protein [Bosea sp. 685]|uniref:winged helix-turn-helix domain-containing protein n=1 Tax=Bosea sp. 685 TaxID=3080057 RepID=UPI003977E33E
MRFVFGDHVLDAGRHELSRSGSVIAIEPQVFDLLLYLVRNRERMVSKDDVLDSVWQGRIVSESSLTSRINAARKAVSDSGEAQRVIRTVPQEPDRHGALAGAVLLEHREEGLRSVSERLIAPVALARPAIGKPSRVPAGAGWQSGPAVAALRKSCSRRRPLLSSGSCLMPAMRMRMRWSPCW